MGVVLLVITSNGGVVDSNVTRSRADRAQLSVLLDAGLVDAVRVLAKGRGVSIVSLVEKGLEVVVDGYSGVGPGGGARFEGEGGVGGEVGGRDRVDGPVEPAAQRVDWDSLLQRGREAKVLVAASTMARDPIEEIA